MNPRILRISRRHGVLLVQLHRGRGNSLDRESLEALCSLFASTPPEPVVLTGHGRSFCTGLDLEYCLVQDRDGMRRLMRTFHDALRACFAHRAPVVAALNGHALAGGALLSLACDRRVTAGADSSFGIHGVRLGIPYPHVAVELVRCQYDTATAQTVLFGGRLVPMAEAVRVGLVEELIPDGMLMERAIQTAQDLARPSLGTFARNKERIRGMALARIDELGRPDDEAWLDQWFHPTTQRQVRAARGLPDAEAPPPIEGLP